MNRFHIAVLLLSLFACRAPGAGSVLAPPDPPCGMPARDVLAAHGLTALWVPPPAHASLSQAWSYPGGVCFSRALAAAVKALRLDGFARASPVAVAIAATGSPDWTRFAAGGTLTLLNRELPPPIRGEALADAWIFVLTLPHLSDHVYWAAVRRHPAADGALSVSIHGFH